MYVAYGKTVPTHTYIIMIIGSLLLYPMRTHTFNGIYLYDYL